MKDGSMSKYTEQELNNLRCYACEFAFRLYEQQSVEQLQMLKDYVESCLNNIQKEDKKK